MAILRNHRDSPTVQTTIHGQIIPLEQSQGQGPSHTPVARPRKHGEGGTYQSDEDRVFGDEA